MEHRASQTLYTKYEYIAMVGSFIEPSASYPKL